MEKKQEKKLVNLILQILILQRDIKGIIKIIRQFQLKNISDLHWTAITQDFHADEIIEILSLPENEDIKEKFATFLNEKGSLKNVILFGLELNTLEHKSVAEKTQKLINGEKTVEAAEELLYAGERLKSSEYLHEAKKMARELGHAKTFIESCRQMEVEPEKKDLINILIKNLEILIKQSVDKVDGKRMLPECRDCLNILNYLGEDGAKIKKILFG